MSKGHLIFLSDINILNKFKYFTIIYVGVFNFLSLINGQMWLLSYSWKFEQITQESMLN